MLCTKYRPITETDGTPEEIFWNNMKTVDKYHDLLIMVKLAHEWMKTENRTYQHLETEFRNRGFNTHLIATPLTGKVISPSKSQFEPEYICIFSCRPSALALKELLTYSDSYEINYDKLAMSGDMVIDNCDIEDSKKDESNSFSDTKETHEHEMIIQNKVIVEITEQSAEDVISRLEIQIKEKYGTSAVPMLLGIGPTGGPIFALTVDGKIVTDIGFTICYDNDSNKITKLVNLN